MRTSQLLLLVLTVGLYAGAAWTYELYVADLEGAFGLIVGEGPFTEITAEITVAYQNPYGFIPIGLASAASLLLGYFIADLRASKGRPVHEKLMPWELSARFALCLLDGDKRKVFSELVEAGGEILQSELPLRAGFSKAKITRILDSLEGKGLVIRKRYGMTNKVLINRNMLAETTSRRRIR